MREAKCKFQEGGEKVDVVRHSIVHVLVSTYAHPLDSTSMFVLDSYTLFASNFPIKRIMYI